MDKRAQISEIVKRFSKEGVAPPTPDESLFDSGLLDSFALTDLVAELEKQFDLKIPDSDLNPRKFDSIERIEEYLAESGK